MSKILKLEDLSTKQCIEPFVYNLLLLFLQMLCRTLCLEMDRGSSEWNTCLGMLLVA